MLAASLLALLGLAGCAPLNRLRTQLGLSAPMHPSVVFTPTAPAPKTPERAVKPLPDVSLATIIKRELQRGHYAEGERALRGYLARHPGDRLAQLMLRQLTTDPERMLGSASRPHVVRSGDSYGVLAAHYLGDSRLFLILARYNGSTNPSVLRLGEKLRLPTAAAAALRKTADDKPKKEDAPTPAAETVASTAPPAKTIPDAGKTRAAEVERLQQESLTLLGQGHQKQALARIDKALVLDPQLKPEGASAAALRKQVLASYHQRAIVLYRDQQLDQAIALWDRVLAIDPNYEAATVYRTRALELKRRLKQF